MVKISSRLGMTKNFMTLELTVYSTFDKKGKNKNYIITEQNKNEDECFGMSLSWTDNTHKLENPT